MMHIIQATDITITNSDDTTETFHLDVPTGENRLQWGFRKVILKSNYRDPDLIFRRGFDYYQMVALFSYSWHTMDIRKLLTAKNIRIKVPPKFGVDTTQYQQFDTRLSNEEAIRNFLKGLAIGSPESVDPVVPFGELTLEFEGRKPFTTQEMLSFRFNQPPDPPQNVILLAEEPLQVRVGADPSPSQVLGYNAYQDDGSNTVKDNSSLLTEAEIDDYTFDNVQEEVLYTFWFTSVNSFSESFASNLVQGTPAVPPPPNNFSLDLSPASSYVSVPHTSSLLLTGGFVIQAWVNPADFATHRFIFSKGGNDFYLRTELSGKLRFQLRNSAGNSLFYVGNNSIGLNWVNTMVVFDPDNQKIRFRINGVLDSEHARPEDMKSTTAALLIGQRFGSNFWAGLMDEFRIWDDASFEQFAIDNYNRSLTDVEAAMTAAYWRAETGTGSTLFDSSLNGNHGSMINDAAFSESTPFP